MCYLGLDEPWDREALASASDLLLSADPAPPGSPLPPASVLDPGCGPWDASLAGFETLTAFEAPDSPARAPEDPSDRFPRARLHASQNKYYYSVAKLPVQQKLKNEGSRIQIENPET